MYGIDAIRFKHVVEGVGSMTTTRGMSRMYNSKTKNNGGKKTSNTMGNRGRRCRALGHVANTIRK